MNNTVKQELEQIMEAHWQETINALDAENTIKNSDRPNKWINEQLWCTWCTYGVGIDSWIPQPHIYSVNSIMPIHIYTWTRWGKRSNEGNEVEEYLICEQCKSDLPNLVPTWENLTKHEK